MRHKTQIKVNLKAKPFCMQFIGCAQNYYIDTLICSRYLVHCSWLLRSHCYLCHLLPCVLLLQSIGRHVPVTNHPRIHVHIGVAHSRHTIHHLPSHHALRLSVPFLGAHHAPVQSRHHARLLLLRATQSLSNRVATQTSHHPQGECITGFAGGCGGGWRGARAEELRQVLVFGRCVLTRATQRAQHPSSTQSGVQLHPVRKAQVGGVNELVREVMFQVKQGAKIWKKRGKETLIRLLLTEKTLIMRYIREQLKYMPQKWAMSSTATVKEPIFVLRQFNLKWDKY